MLKLAKIKLMDYLASHNIDESGQIIVANVRKQKKNRVGYYSRMSQFRSRARIVVDPLSIRDYLLEYRDEEPTEADVSREVFKTIAHEYGHMIAEAIRHLPNFDERFDVPDWIKTFDGDEEAFAEDFARLAVGDHPLMPDFWEAFMPRYAAEFNRLFRTE